MRHIPLYTIGHGNRSFEDILEILQRYAIAYVLDIRSQPYSRFNPSFSREPLAAALTQHGHQYVFMGNTLGGRPDDATCYRDGRIDYALLKEASCYREGLARLRTIWQKQLRVVLLCSELKPQECHRGKLIGNSLLEEEIAVAHIDEQGELRTQEEVNLLLTGGQLTLFEDMSPVELNGKIGRSRKKY